MFIADISGIFTVFHIDGYRPHGTRSVQSESGNEIFHADRLKFGKTLRHSPALKLKNTACVAA